MKFEQKNTTNITSHVDFGNDGVIHCKTTIKAPEVITPQMKSIIDGFAGQHKGVDDINQTQLDLNGGGNSETDPDYDVDEAEEDEG